MTKEEKKIQIKDNSTSWYNMPDLTDLLVFLFPPLGIYVLYKFKKKLSKPTKPEVKSSIS